MSNYKVDGVDLDDLFELRGGRTPLASATGFKVGGVDLNDRYLNVNHPNSVPPPSLSQYKVGGVNLSNFFSEKLLYTVTRIVASDVTTNMFFGAGVSCSGNGLYVIVGTNTDGAYIFFYSGGVWTQQQKITPGFVSNRVTINSDGDRCAIASTAGSTVAVYNRSGTTWTLEDSFSATNNVQSIHIDAATGSGRLITGSPVGTSPGNARVFVRSGGTWSLEQTITSSQSGARRFGHSVSMNNNYLIIGDPIQNSSASGYCHIYERSGSTWGNLKVLQAPGGDVTTGGGVDGIYDKFGFSVSMTPAGDRCAIGVPSLGPNSSFVYGGHYTATRSGSDWTLSTVSNSFFVTYGARSGHSVAVSGDGNRRIAGSPGRDSNSGGVAHYATATAVKANYGTTSSAMGNAVSISTSGGVVVAAAQSESLDASNGGGVYIYHY